MRSTGTSSQNTAMAGAARKAGLLVMEKAGIQDYVIKHCGTHRSLHFEELSNILYTRGEQ